MLLLAAVTTDIRSYRISNRLICMGLFTGLLFQIWESGIQGIFLFLLQIILPVVMLYLLFLMRALGAGDIKLFSVIGGIWNLKIVCYCILFSFLFGAVYSLLLLIAHKNLLPRLQYFWNYMRTALAAKRIGRYDRESDGKRNIIHFSIAVLLGYIVTMGVIY